MLGGIDDVEAEGIEDVGEGGDETGAVLAGDEQGRLGRFGARFLHRSSLRRAA
jgi:hypothetical protein